MDAIHKMQQEDQALTDMRESLMALFGSIEGLDAQAMMRRFEAYGQQMYNLGFSVGRCVQEGQLTLW